MRRMSTGGNRRRGSGMDGEAAPREKRYWVYILRCADGTLYTGITNDVPVSGAG